MGLFRRKSKSKNWDLLDKQEYKDSVKNRDVHSTQNLERGERGEISKPHKQRIFALIIASIFGGLGFLVGYVLLIAWAFFDFIKSSGGASYLGFDMGGVNVLGSWHIYAWTGFVFLMTFLIANERFMASWRSANSMIDSTDINTYENDQHIMLPEEMQRTYSWFPDAGAHSSVQVSSMLSHVMIDRKGLKRIDVTERHKKDVKGEQGIAFYKGEAVVDAHGEVIQSKMPIIDEEFGQDLFTASGIPISEKGIRTPVDVRKIEFNPVDESKNRKDRGKLPYDTVADMINGDWELPEYEVQRPAGAYLVDTEPVNTMVLAITRAGKGY